MVARSANRPGSREKRRRFDRGKPAVLSGYRRILVPVLNNAESQRAMAIACRLAADSQASITVVTVVEVPPLLPLDAYMTDEEEDARQLLNRAEAVGVSYGVGLSGRILRAREAESAIVEQAEATAADVVIIGGTRKSRPSVRAPVFGRTIQHVLKKAPCRVIVVAAKADASRPGTRSSHHGRGNTEGTPTAAHASIRGH